MAVIHIRSVPEDLALQLQTQAREHHRSMEAEVRMILAQALRPQPIYRGPRHVNFQLIETMDLEDVVFEPMAPLLREADL